MAEKKNRIMRRRLRNAYLSSLISISLVLLLVGIAAMLLVNARSVSDYFKENMQVSVMMKTEVSDEQAARLSTDIAQRIQDEMTYPGQVKITVIRETRSVAIAK